MGSNLDKYLLPVHIAQIVLGSMPIIGGMFSSLVISSVVLKVGKYKPIAIVLMVVSLIFTILL